MHALEDIRINGQQTSLSTTPTIAGLHPVISWDFAEDVAAPAQFSYSIRIGSGSVNIETSDFAGDLINKSVTSSSNFFEYTLHNLQRGTTYFGQIQANDPDLDLTTWSAFSFTINNLPFVTNFSLSPSSPLSSDDIELSYTYNDSDNHNEAGTKIRWLRNNSPITEFDDLCILPSSSTQPNDSWSVKIIPSDGLEFGSIVETSAVTIQISSTSFSSISILPKNPNVDDILKVEWTLTDNEYTSLVGIVSFEWIINGIAAANSNSQFIRLNTNPGDSVTVILTLSDSSGSILAETSAIPVSMLDVEWHIFDLVINGLMEADTITDLTPILEWKIFKSTASLDDIPNFIRIVITKTQSLGGPIFDSGNIQYTKNSFVIPANILSRGQDYFVHVGISDISPVPNNNFTRKPMKLIGSSWEENIDNSKGWTIETKLSIRDVVFNSDTGEVVDGAIPSLGFLIHDGTFFCTIRFEKNKVVFHSDVSVEANLPNDDLTISKVFRITGKNNDVKIFLNNNLLIDATGKLVNQSKLKFIEYGDIDNKNINQGIIQFVKFSTIGAFGTGDNLPNENTFHFFEIGKIENGTILDILDNQISWLPDDASQSSKIIEFKNNSNELQLPTVTSNFSPITAIHLDSERNKYIGTSNGVNAIFGEKHNPDYEFLTSADDVVITSEDFDRITTVATEDIAAVEPDAKSGWFTIDTTFRTIGVTNPNKGFFSGDPYDPYKFPIDSHVIHYYTQRTHGHPWYDKVDNSKGWQISLSFHLEILEQDDFQEQNIDHQGFGFFINDGKHQEILFFYEDRIRLFFANVFIPITTTTPRNYRIVGKNDNIFIYQKLDNPSITSYQLIANGTGLFTAPASVGGNSRKPKIKFDSQGLYHAIWHDDANRRSQIFYSVFDGSSWSNPEIITQSKFNLRNPVIDVDSLGRIWVAYEDTSWGQTEISVSVKDSVGWNSPVRITNYRSNKYNPSIIIDSFNNVHLVWEDDRNGSTQIFWAERQNNTQAWISSGQFGEDTIVMQQSDFNDPYVEGEIIFKNPQLAHHHPRVWLVAEAIKNDHTSVIYRGFRDTVDSRWNSIGVPIFDNDGNFLSTGVSSRSSPVNRNCTKPSIAINGALGFIVIVWEDQTNPISQIWGSVYNTFGTELTPPTQITSRASNAKNPSAGFASEQCAILFESDDLIYLSNYDAGFFNFNGSATGGSDELIQTTTNRKVANPSLSSFVPAKDFKMVYDFLRVTDQTLASQEFSDYHLIGDATVSHAAASSPKNLILTSTLSDSIVSNIDTKEFAFGDMSENLSLRAHWKDIQLYFGYDARPHTLGSFNSNTVIGWPDDRINDIFVDTFGNLIVATFKGLIYHNVFNGELTNIDNFQNKLVSAVKWGKNGIWYVGIRRGNDDVTGLFLSKSAGRTWESFSDIPSVNSIDIDSNGHAICATDDGVYLVNPNNLLTSQRIAIVGNTKNLPGVSNVVRAIAVDDKNVIWAGGDWGLARIKGISVLGFSKKDGMRSSHVTDITIVNDHLRYIATANGVEKMHGTTFIPISTQSHAILNNNISKISFNAITNSLWIASLHSLYEIVFKDAAHEIILDEIVQYDSTELLTESNFEQSVYNILDIDLLSSDLAITSETTSALINKNKIDFGFSVSESGESITFSANLLTDDEVEVLISDQFKEFHNFNQTSIEQKAQGEKRTIINKLARTSTLSKLLLLSGGDKNQILRLASESSLPFTTILLDRDLPQGIFEKLDTLSPTSIRFKILSFDEHSGIDGYVLSNFANFTSDGETPLDFNTLPSDGIVTHSIGSDLNNTFTSLTFPSSTTISGVTYTVDGEGSALGKWTKGVNTTILYAATNSPAIIWKLNPDIAAETIGSDGETNASAESWTAIAALGTSSADINTREVTEIKTFNNVMFVATKSTSGGNGIVYKTVDGDTFEVAATTAFSSTFNAIGSSGSGGDGTVFFGDGSGRIFKYINNSVDTTKTIESIGDEVLSLAVFQNILLAGTGNKGRVYLINLDTNDNFPIFSGSESDINEIHIKDEFVDSLAEAIIYSGSSESTTIYKANLDALDFIKSFNSFAKNINRIRTISSSALDTPSNNEDSDIQVVSSIGDSLFKHNEPAWEFFFKHDEEIIDFIEHDSSGVVGVFIISNSKITKWTNELSDKTVYLRLKDKAGNFSENPTVDPKCPGENESDNVACCQYAYSLKIADLKDFVNESRIIDITEYGQILFTFDSPTDRSFYSADEIDEEIGVYTSEVFNGSNDLVAWKSIGWTATEPDGTSVAIQIRSGVTQTETETSDWSVDLVKEVTGLVSLEHITNQYIQFRSILKSQTRDLSPTLSSVVLRNLTTQASHFFTTNFIMPSRPIKGLLTTNTFIPVTADVVFGINTKNSVDFGDYQIIEPNRLFTTVQGQFGKDFRIGAKLLSPGVPQLTATDNAGDPYDSSSFVCTIEFTYVNSQVIYKDFHFRIKFYNDQFRTQLIHTFFSGNDQTGWSHGSGSNNFPGPGLTLGASDSSVISFEPLDNISSNQKWFITVEAHDGTFFETVSDDKSFICSSCNITNEINLISEYYKTGLPASLVTVPQFSSFTPDFSLLENNIFFAETSGDWSTTKGQSLSGFDNNFAARFRGKIQAPVAGTYTFELQSNDGSILFINAEEIISHDGVHGFTTKTGTITLTEGFHDIEVQYFDGTGSAGLDLRWITPDETIAVTVPSQRFFHAVANEYCDDTGSPKIFNFAVLFELENGENVKLNISP